MESGQTDFDRGIEAAIKEVKTYTATRDERDQRLLNFVLERLEKLKEKKCQVPVP